LQQGVNKFFLSSVILLSGASIGIKRGQPWRIGPEISEDWQKSLAERWATVPDIEKGYKGYRED